MSVDITLRFANDDDADVFLRGLEHGHIDGYRLRELKDDVSVVGEEAVS